MNVPMVIKKLGCVFLNYIFDDASLVDLLQGK